MERGSTRCHVAPSVQTGRVPRSELRTAAVVGLVIFVVTATGCSAAAPRTTSTPATTTTSATKPNTSTTGPAPRASGPVVTGTGWNPSGLTGPMPPPGRCHYRTASDGYQLPDPTCTPGAIDAGVTQADIRATICRSGYTDLVRPPDSITEPAKYEAMAAYRSPGSASAYEYDHLVPLELGGSSDARNLWPELDVGSPSQFDSRDSYGENAKDGVEDRLTAAVCAGQVTLAAAQQAIAADWTTAETVLGVSP